MAKKTEEKKTEDKKKANDKEAGKLSERLSFQFKHIGKESPEQFKKAEKFCEGYKEFLDKSKTERECVRESIRIAREAGFTEFDRDAEQYPGRKAYYNNRDKSLILVTFGAKPLSEGVRFNIAHLDSPRLDLKPFPLYEQDEIALFKTHYYGGIKKYQWGTTPLAMHGAVILKDGTKVEVSIGEKEGEPQFVISDLLIHLAGKQQERPLKEGLRGEELNILVGSIPYMEEEDYKEPVKLMSLKALNDLYGMTEEDFLRAELEFVPAVKAVDIGLDRSMIGGYGQDDKVCVYTALMAALEMDKPEYTTVTVFTDKEEIGSDGNTGMASRMLDHFMEDLCEKSGARLRDVYKKSLCLSSDVNAAYDPTFGDVFEKNNSSFLNHGPVLTKYTGSRGKSSSNDASAETMARFIAFMEEDGVIWQAGELGKVDEGGGGTIAMFMGNRDVDTVDLGVPVLSMHAPFEITSKLDVYYTYKAYKAFYK